MTNPLKNLDVSQRLTILDAIGTPADGQSLAGQNVNEFPAGVLFYVRSVNRLYTLRKNLNASMVPAGNDQNIINGIGSTAAAGRFVACAQRGFGTLAAGSVILPGFDTSRGGHFLVSYVQAGGTQGFLRGVIVSPGSIGITSSSGSDTSQVVCEFLEGAES